MTGVGPRVSWALVDEVLAALERHGIGRPEGQPSDRVITLIQDLAAACTTLPDQPAPPVRASGPVPDWPAPGLSGAPVPGRTRGAAGWGGEPASVRDAYDQRPAAGEADAPADGREAGL